MKVIRLLMRWEIPAALIISSTGCVSMTHNVDAPVNRPSVPDIVRNDAGSLSAEVVAMEKLVHDLADVVTLLSEEKFLNQPREAVEAYLTAEYRERLLREQQATAFRGGQFHLPGMDASSDLSIYHTDPIPAGATLAELDFSVGNPAVPGTGYHILVGFQRVHGKWRINAIDDLGNG